MLLLACFWFGHFSSVVSFMFWDRSDPYTLRVTGKYASPTTMVLGIFQAYFRLCFEVVLILVLSRWQENMPLQQLWCGHFSSVLWFMFLRLCVCVWVPGVWCGTGGDSDDSCSLETVMVMAFKIVCNHS